MFDAGSPFTNAPGQPRFALDLVEEALDVFESQPRRSSWRSQADTFTAERRFDGARPCGRDKDENAR